MRSSSSPRTRAAPAPFVVLVLLALATSACGVPRDGTTHTIDAKKVPYNLLAPAPDASEGPVVSGQTVTPQVFFVNGDDLLVPQPEPVEASGVQSVVSDLLRRLAAGPSEQERDLGLANALGPDTGLRLVDLSDRIARIEVIPSGPSPAADRLPLAVGQIVLTVTSVDGVDQVRFALAGADIEAPLPGGVRTSTPVGPADYASLVAPFAGPVTKAEPGPPTPTAP